MEQEVNWELKDEHPRGVALSESYRSVLVDLTDVQEEAVIQAYLDAGGNTILPGLRTFIKFGLKSLQGDAVEGKPLMGNALIEIYTPKSETTWNRAIKAASIIEQAGPGADEIFLAAIKTWDGTLEELTALVADTTRQNRGVLHD